MNTKKVIAITIVLTFLSISVFVPTYTEGQTSTIRGKVSDKQGDPLSDAKIILLDPSTGRKYSLKSNKKGEFVKVGVIPSVYKISVNIEGYLPFESQYKVDMGMQEVLNISLEKIPPRIQEDRDYTDGVNFFQQGQYEEAIEAFKKTIEKYPNDIDAHYNLGVSHLRAGNLEEAISQLNKAAEMNPEVMEIHLALGECYFRKEESEKALAAFNKALEIQPDNPKAYYNLGMVYYKYDQAEEAIHAFKKSLELNSKLSSAYYQLGLVYIKTGDSSQALKCFEGFLKLEPDSPEAKLVKDLIAKIK